MSLTAAETSALLAGRRRCEDKTAAGNCYLCRAEAEERAKQMSLRKGQKILAFRCKFGQHWHLGGYRKRTEGDNREDC